MKFFFFHLMPYSEVDLDYVEEHQQSHVKLPNTLYDPEKGAALYERYIEEHVFASNNGFDAVCVNEHHQTAYGMMPAPNVMAGALSQRIKEDCKIAVLGRALPLLANPLSVAEEYAMLDNMTKGRLIAGFVRGIGTEYHATATNPVESHGRFREALDLIIDSWTKPGPFPHEGEYYNNPYVNVWPTPYQKPHPPIALPSTGSSETVLFAARKDRQYLYLQTSAPSPTIIKYMNMYTEAAKNDGYEADPNNMGWAPQIYVAETDEIAIKEARRHIENFANYFMIITPELFLPPGYTSRESMKAILKAKANVMKKTRKIEEMMETNTFICGSPQTVIDKITDLQRKGGFNVLAADPHFGTLPHDLTMKNIEMLGSEVIPVLKDVTPASYKSQAA
jgi:alkanesulfonate monooxygenase SsuD/methylene tetrahydromethanopterin reductase-like flavin-dependent oxidoreductase (luciferase family)